MPKYQPIIAAVSLALFAVVACAGEPTWTDPAKAAAENADFNVQGEYAGDKPADTAYQVIAMGDGKFTVVECEGGLPGAPGSAFTSKTTVHADVDAAKVKQLVGDAHRVQRTSPTLGAKAPAGAIVLFDGSKDSLSNWNKASLDGNALCEGTTTKKSFGSFTLHLEFRLPYKPTRQPSNQDRGNSGLYIHNRYETQIIDTFGLHYNAPDKDAWRSLFKQQMGYDSKSDRTQWCASLYHFKNPDLNVAYPPLAWQTYDIEFTAAKFDANGNKTANARITVVHNGIKVQDNVELPKGTGAGGKRPEIPAGSLLLQGHGNPVRFQNIWIIPK